MPSTVFHKPIYLLSVHSHKDAFWTILAVELPLPPSALILFGKLCMCQPHVVFEGMKNTKLWRAVLRGSIWHNNYCCGSVSRYLFKCLTYNMKKEEQESMSARMHLLHLLLLWDTMKHTNLVAQWYANKYVYVIFHGFFIIFLNPLSANPTKW